MQKTQAYQTKSKNLIIHFKPNMTPLVMETNANLGKYISTDGLGVK